MLWILEGVTCKSLLNEFNLLCRYILSFIDFSLSNQFIDKSEELKYPTIAVSEPTYSFISIIICLYNLGALRVDVYVFQLLVFFVESSLC